MWLAHGTTGVAVFFFLLVHVTDTALVAAIVFHPLNGRRIISVDVWEWANRHLGHVFGGE
jgi:succinate dehydrogenase / fumarate reductase cytochrome b subunit